jgi:hypothetical protein
MTRTEIMNIVDNGERVLRLMGHVKESTISIEHLLKTHRLTSAQVNELAKDFESLELIIVRRGRDGAVKRFERPPGFDAADAVQAYNGFVKLVTTDTDAEDIFAEDVEEGAAPMGLAVGEFSKARKVGQLSQEGRIRIAFIDDMLKHVGTRQPARIVPLEARTKKNGYWQLVGIYERVRKMGYRAEIVYATHDQVKKTTPYARLVKLEQERKAAN